MLKILLITGGAKRIGREICLHLATQGWQIVIHYNNSLKEAKKLQNEINAISKAIIIKKDLNNLSNFKGFFQKIKQRMGVPTLLINNAAIFSADNITSVTAKNLEGHMHVNCFAPILLTQEIIKINQDAQHINIINILDNSIDLNGSKSFLSYSLSKSCLSNATKLLASQVNSHCRISAISPGFVMKTPDQTNENFEKLIKDSGKHKTKIEDICTAIDHILSNKKLNNVNIDLSC
jgi:NAD(P)-dependent dehydrogenase (short-subunit alcohol dehydrogenase family)